MYDLADPFANRGRERIEEAGRAGAEDRSRGQESRAGTLAPSEAREGNGENEEVEISLELRSEVQGAEGGMEENIPPGREEEAERS